MARRRLEDAILAGQEIEKDWPSTYDVVDVKDQVPFQYERDGVFSLQFSLDGDLLAVGYGNGGIELLESRTGKKLADARHSKYGGLAVTCLRFHPKLENALMASTAEGVIYFCTWKIEDNVIKDVACTDCVVEKGNEINCFDYSLDGCSYATGGKDLDIRIYDAATNEVVREYTGYHVNAAPTETVKGHAHRIFALRYHPENNNIFVTGGWDNHLKIWDARSSDGVKRTIHGPHICGDSLDIKGNRILTGSWAANHAFRLWNYSEGTLEREIPFPDDGQGAFLYCAQFCTDDIVIGGGSGTKSAKVINMKTEECLGTIKMSRPVQAVDTCHGGGLIAVGGADNFLQLAKLR